VEVLPTSSSLAAELGGGFCFSDFRMTRPGVAAFGLTTPGLWIRDGSPRRWLGLLEREGDRLSLVEIARGVVLTGDSDGGEAAPPRKRRTPFMRGEESVRWVAALVDYVLDVEQRI
jgi:hypothetical protein